MPGPLVRVPLGILNRSGFTSELTHQTRDRPKRRNSRKRYPRVPRRDRQSGHTNSDTHAPHDKERPRSHLDVRVNVEEITRRMQTTVATSSRIEEESGEERTTPVLSAELSRQKEVDGWPVLER